MMNRQSLSRLSFLLISGLAHTASFGAHPNPTDQALKNRFCQFNCNRVFCLDRPHATACRELCNSNDIINCLKAAGLPPKEDPAVPATDPTVQAPIPAILTAAGVKLPGMNPEVGEVGYVSLDVVLPGQLRVDQSNIEKKAEEQQKFLATEEGQKRFSLHHSTLTEKQAVPVVKVLENGKMVYRVVDSHHEVLAAIQKGSQRIPIKVMADLTALGDTPIKELEKQGYIDLYDREGKKHERLDMGWDQLKTQQDDLRAYITSHVKKMVWGTGEDKTPNVKVTDTVIVKAVALLPDSEITLNTHLENRLSTVLRTLVPSFNPKTATTPEFKEALKTHLEHIQKLYPQFEKVRFILDTDEKSAKTMLERYTDEIKKGS
jgi:hypothetical protein